MIKGGVGKISESELRVQTMLQPLMYFRCSAAATSVSKSARSSATAKSTARPSCLVAVLWHLSGDDQQINSYSTTFT